MIENRYVVNYMSHQNRFHDVIHCLLALLKCSRLCRFCSGVTQVTKDGRILSLKLVLSRLIKLLLESVLILTF